MNNTSIVTLAAINAHLRKIITYAIVPHAFIYPTRVLPLHVLVPSHPFDVLIESFKNDKGLCIVLPLNGKSLSQNSVVCKTIASPKETMAARHETMASRVQTLVCPNQTMATRDKTLACPNQTMTSRVQTIEFQVATIAPWYKKINGKDSNNCSSIKNNGIPKKNIRPMQ